MRPSEHLRASLDAIGSLRSELDHLAEIGERLGVLLARGGKLLVVGNGGSAAEAQHLSAELVGRYRDDRRSLSAIALHAESSSLTAIANDYGYEMSFARQVRAHARTGDAVLALSTSGRSPNVVRALEVARELGLWSIALTGSRSCPMAELVDDLVAVDAPAFATQEAHLVAVHVLCDAVDAVVAAGNSEATACAGQWTPR
jgi:phosphoheptose isomerase